jgi:hypothetical protein
MTPGLKFERNEYLHSCIIMEKTIRTSVVMSTDSTILPTVAAVLSLRNSIPGTVSADTQQKIANLRGILDSKTLSSARNGGDWRRGTNNPVQNTVESRFRQGGSTMRNGFMRNSNSTGSLSNGSNGSGTPRTPVGTPVASPPAPKQTYTGPPLGRYQSRFRNQTEPIEEKILNRIIRLKLNKFGPTTYTEIRDFLFQILGQESIATEDDGQVQAEAAQDLQRGAQADADL